jgi:hypothetical protein
MLLVWYDSECEITVVIQKERKNSSEFCRHIGELLRKFSC